MIPIAYDPMCATLARRILASWSRRDSEPFVDRVAQAMLRQRSQ